MGLQQLTGSRLCAIDRVEFKVTKSSVKSKGNPQTLNSFEHFKCENGKEITLSMSHFIYPRGDSMILTFHETLQS